MMRYNVLQCGLKWSEVERTKSYSEVLVSYAVLSTVINLVTMYCFSLH